MRILVIEDEVELSFSICSYLKNDNFICDSVFDYYEALQIEEDPYDRSFILYNIGLIFSSNGEYLKALDYYHQALELNSNLPQAFNNIAVSSSSNLSQAFPDKTIWKQAMFGVFILNDQGLFSSEKIYDPPSI